MLRILEPSRGKQARLEPKSSGHRRKLDPLCHRMAQEQAGMKKGISYALFRRSPTVHAV